MDKSNSAKSLSTVFSGAAMLMVGYVLGGILTLATKVVVARFFTSEVYGVFSQGMSVLFALVVVSMLGLNAGVSRFISYYSGNNNSKAVSAVPSSLIVVIPFSILLFGLLYIVAEPIAILGFEDPRTTTVLKVFAIAGPFMAISSIFVSGFRGYKKSKERVVLLDFIIPFLQLLGILILVSLGYQFFGATVGFASGFVITTLAAFLWYRKSYSLEIEENVLSELVKFSWPLMLSAIAVQIFLWSPSILVGLLSTSQDVGLFNAALPLGAATKMFLSSIAFLFMPVAADLFSKNKIGEMNQVYSIATRWLATFSIPVIVFLFFLSEQSIVFLFGSEYASAGTALSIMIIGYLVNMLTGPVGDLLIAVGKTKKEALANIVKLTVFLVLSLLFIPEYGFVGAAASFAAGMFVGNALRLWFCWEYVGMFFTIGFLKSFIAVVPATILAVLIQESVGFLPISVVAFGSSYLLALAVTKPIENRDREIIKDFRSGTSLEDLELLDIIIDRLSSVDSS